MLWPQQSSGRPGASMGTAHPAGEAQQEQGLPGWIQQEEARRRKAAAATIRAMDPALKAQFVAHLLRLHPDLSASLSQAHTRLAAVGQRVAPAPAPALVPQPELPAAEARPCRAQSAAAGGAAALPDLQWACAAQSPAGAARSVAAARAAPALPAAGPGARTVKDEPANQLPCSTPEWEHHLLCLPPLSFYTPDGVAATPRPAGSGGDALRPLSTHAAAALLASPPSQSVSFFAGL